MSVEVFQVPTCYMNQHQNVLSPSLPVIFTYLNGEKIKKENKISNGGISYSVMYEAGVKLCSAQPMPPKCFLHC